MAEQQFQVGSVVSLVSGGPLMTVRSHASDGTYQCVWFVWTGDEWTGPHTGWFNADDLVSSVVQVRT